MYAGSCDMLCPAMRDCSWWRGNAHIDPFACRVVNGCCLVCHLAGGDTLISFVVRGVGTVDVLSVCMCCVDGRHVGGCVWGCIRVATGMQRCLE
jgi:hypothetical protein